MLRLHPDRIVVLYILVSVFWILFSDHAVYSIGDFAPEFAHWLHTIKGWFFVGVSALLLRKAMKFHESETLAKDQALRESEAKFRNLFAYVPMPMCVLSKDLRFAETNERFVQTFGYQPEDMPDLETWWVKAYPDEAYRQWVRTTWDLAVSTAKRERMDIPAAEYKVTCKNGEKRSFIISGVPIGQECLVTFRDVSEQKAVTSAQAALRASEQSYLNLLENMNEAVVMLEMLYDEQGNPEDYLILSINKGYERILGVGKDQVQGRRVKEAFNLDYLPDLERYRVVVETGQPAHFESYFEPQNLFLMVSSYWLGGKRFAAVFTDVSETVAAQKKLEHQTALLSGLIDSSPDLIFVKDLNGVYLECNPAFAAFVGKEKKDILGSTDFELFTKETAEFFRAQDELMFKIGSPRHNDEWINYPDKNVVLLDTLKAPFISHSGELLGLLGIGRDITERYRLEEDLRKSTTAAKAASQAKSLFLANMSHEIRTPLNGLMGMMQLMKTTGLNEEQDGYVAMALRSGRRLNELLSDILDLTRIEANAIPLVKEPFQLADILNALRETFETQCAQKGVLLRIDKAAELPTGLLGDEMRVRQILFNLVGNAIKFSDHSEVLVEVMTLPASSPTLSKMLFVIRDHGIGISDAQLEGIFEAFNQVENDYTRSHQGAGLGLAIVKRLVLLMGGSLAVESEAGAGTSVYLMIPFLRSAGKVAAKDRQPVTGESQPRALRVLLAEDDEISMRSMRTFLQKQGFQVFTADDGNKVLEVLRANTVDCVLMDVQMPNVSGIEATSRIRQDQSGDFDPNVPIVAMTAYAMSGDKERFLAAGMDDYLSKPVDFDILLPLMDRLLGENKEKAKT